MSLDRSIDDGYELMTHVFLAAVVFNRFKGVLRSFDAMRRVVFVCSGNLDRSPTAEEMFRERSDLEVRSAGTSLLSALRTRLSRDLVNWADVIFVMEDRHAEYIAQKLGMPDALEKVIVLGIPDRYRKNDPELRRLLRERVAPHLDVH